MAKQNQVAEAKSDKKSRPKIKPTVGEERSDDLAGLPKLANGLIAAMSDGIVEVQAAQLGDVRLSTVQRQALAVQIGRLQGNDHLQRVVASLGQNEARAEDGRTSAGGKHVVQQSGNVLQRAKSTVLNGTRNERRSARSALKKAERMVNKAQIRIGGQRRARYKTWYDTNYSSTNATRKTRFDTVKKGWIKIHSVFLSKRIYFDCSARNESYYAEVDTSDGKYKIKLGKDFWSATETGRDSRGGAIVHEISHEELDTDDHVYGEADAKQLAQNDPGKAIDNADNWEYFAEDSY